MFVLELQVLPVLRRSPEGSGAPMDFADEARRVVGGFALIQSIHVKKIHNLVAVRAPNGA